MPVLMIAGLVSLVLGIVLFFAWFGYIVALIKAVLPLVFIIGGAVASYLGWEEMRESRSPAMDFSNPDEASRYKAEAKAYQAELNDIQVVPPDENKETGSPGAEAPGPEAEVKTDGGGENR